jgi:hypothetical protein
MQNSDEDWFGEQTVDSIYHIPKEFGSLFHRTHVN